MTLGKQSIPAETAPASDAAQVPAWRARSGVVLAGSLVLAAVMVLAAPVPATAAEHAPEKAAGAPSKTEEPNLDAIKEAIGRDEFEPVVTALRSLAYKGNADAQVLLGDLHMEGRGVYHNYSMAGSWYRRAADADNAEAQFKLAAMYLNGIGVPLFPKQAREWLMKAAEQGHQEARSNLRRLGVEPPPIKVKEPEETASKKGE